MKIIAIISEYNPFHLGHLYQINYLKKLFGNEKVLIVSIMSGNFIQRGEPAIIEKFKRCETVLNSGVNLCLEIPIHITLSSAETFAYGTVKILNELKCIDYICFGCEDASKNKLNKISNALLSFKKEELKKFLDLGFSFAKSQELIIKEKFNDELLTNYIKSPNNILAIEYTKALKILNSKIKIIPIQRIGSNYNDTSLSKSFSSATSIRKFLKESDDISILKNHLPESTYKILKKDSTFIDKEMMFKYLKYKILTNGNLNKIDGINEGLDNKIYHEISKSNSLNELILKVKSKRYPYSRISRSLSKYFIGFENFDQKIIKNFNNYIRILGFDKNGRDILNKIKKQTNLNLISKFDKKNQNLAPLDILSTKAYSILNNNVSPYKDFENPPIIKY